MNVESSHQLQQNHNAYDPEYDTINGKNTAASSSWKDYNFQPVCNRATSNRSEIWTD